MLKQIGFSVLAAFLLSAPAQAQSGDSIAGLPEYYTVQPGDTLWEISQKFLGDPYYWPRLWSINDYITNPHWIYPGNRIVFRMGSDVEGVSVSMEGTDTSPIKSIDIVDDEIACGPDVRFTAEWDSDIYNASGFLAERRDVEVYGEVEFARPGATILAEQDLIYLKVDDPDAFACGDVVSIFHRLKKKVRHPNNRRTQFGNLYAIVGEAQIVHHYGDYVSAVIRDSVTEVQRGDLIGPQMPVHIEVDVRNPSGDLQATVIERLNQESVLASTREVVFIDRGRADGLRVGNSFFIVHQMDELINEEDTALPPSVVGRLVVLRVDEYASTAVVTDSSRSIKIGDRLVQEVE